MHCKIIRDLLPLYHDEAASEESRALVDEHLKTCAVCKKELEDIRESVKEKQAPSTRQPMANGLKLLQKGLRRKTLVRTVIAVLCALVLVSGLTYGLFFYETPVPYQEIAESLTQPINSALDCITQIKGHKSISVFGKDGALYICYFDTFWTRCISKPDGQLLLEIPIAPESSGIITVPGDFDFPITTLLVLPEPPEPPNPLIEMDKATKVYYYKGNISQFAHDEQAFAKAVASAVLLWEE